MDLTLRECKLLYDQAKLNLKDVFNSANPDADINNLVTFAEDILAWAHICQYAKAKYKQLKEEAKEEAEK